jgi:long-chain acyl-CoA synthetase
MTRLESLFPQALVLPVDSGETCGIQQLIDSNAARDPQGTYFIATHDGRAISFAELQRACAELGSYFASRGLRRGDVVSLFLPNGVEAALLILGSMYHGLVVNPINLLSQPAQLRYILEHSETRLLLTVPEHEQPMREIAAQLPRAPGIEVVADAAWLDRARGEALRPEQPAQVDDAALLMYTSGTTGTPKGVVLSHGNLCANGINISREHMLGAGDRGLAPLPLYHINALVVNLITPLTHGGSLVMPPRFSASSFWRDALEFRCTWVNAVPTIIAYLIQSAPPELGPQQLRHIRFCRSASAALPPEHHRAFESRFGVDIIETMGLTETAAPSFSNPVQRALRKIGSIGRPSGTVARVVGTDGALLADGQVGEIQLRGGNVMRGYLKNPAETAKAFTDDGWFRTGDLGYRDADGYYFITGRAKELIIKGGENIAPREIDEALLKHSAVLEAAAVGVQDSNYGQNIEAYLVLRPGAELHEHDLREHCLRHLGRYKTPRACYIVDDLPRGPSGKIQRLKLAELPADAVRRALQLTQA